MKLFTQYIVLIIACCLLTCCSLYRAHISVKAKEAQVPVSMTETFFDQNNKIVTKDMYVIKNHFREEYHQKTFSGWFQGKKQVDIGERINELVEVNDADAAVNITVAGGGQDWNSFFNLPNFFIGCPTLGLISFSIATVVVEGDVVKMLPQELSNKHINTSESVELTTTTQKK